MWEQSSSNGNSKSKKSRCRQVQQTDWQQCLQYGGIGCVEAAIAAYEKG